MLAAAAAAATNNSGLKASVRPSRLRFPLPFERYKAVAAHRRLFLPTPDITFFRRGQVCVFAGQKLYCTCCRADRPSTTSSSSACGVFHLSPCDSLSSAVLLYVRRHITYLGRRYTLSFCHLHCHLHRHLCPFRQAGVAEIETIWRHSLFRMLVVPC